MHVLYKELSQLTKNRLFNLSVICCISLISIKYYKNLIPYDDILRGINDVWNPKGSGVLYEWSGLLLWVFISITGYVIIPLIFLLIQPKSNQCELGLRKIAKSSIPVYLILAGIMVLIVFAISFNKEFQQVYPFYKYYDGGRFWNEGFIWEMAYVLQFFALEFFFRGFLIHQSAPILGINSIFFSMIPYCMIHFQKPLPECVGSIFAGFILGWLSYKTKSIWGGVFLHVTVALSMDIFSCLHQNI
jgi:membrane protease YdiL (CAAX protease family)